MRTLSHLCILWVFTGAISSCNGQCRQIPTGGHHIFSWTEPASPCSNSICTDNAHAKDANCSGFCLNTGADCKYSCPANN